VLRRCSSVLQVGTVYVVTAGEPRIVMQSRAFQLVYFNPSYDHGCWGRIHCTATLRRRKPHMPSHSTRYSIVINNLDICPFIV
jgi:hypothetical protein